MPTSRIVPRAFHEPGSVQAAYRGLVALSVATFVAITTEVLPVGLLPQIADGVDVAEATAGLLVSVYALLVATLAVPLTILTRRLPRKPLLLGTLLAYAVANVVVAAAPGFGVVAAGRAIGGVSHAVFFSISIGYASRLVRPEFTGRALTIATVGGSAGFVVGVPLSTSLGTALGWRTAFAVLALACAVAAALVLVMLPPVRSGDPERDAAAAPRTGRGRLAAVSAVNSLTFLGQYAVYTFVSLILLGAGLSEGAVGPVLLGFGAVGLLGVWYAGLTVDSRPRAGLLGALVGVGGGLAALGLVYPGLAGVLVVGVVWLGSFGSMPAVLQAAAIRTRGASPDVSGALVNSSANLGIGLGAALGGLALDRVGLDGLPWVGAVILAAAIVVVLLAPRAFPARA
ncbi:MFS transporter [Cellulomonas sp. PhB143]|uniref:MFS transporter n=1 Tax=Cellulomonas sp. PhB143 TaxID=2485186 RepID=UPI000F48CA8A|nr:MFS transporter [Cellulomonas sp. PhB143]ROS75323.1 putative MFS family arabinose efflux permease [Cellulomonas sp. PhB143]